MPDLKQGWPKPTPRVLLILLVAGFVSECSQGDKPPPGMDDPPPTPPTACDLEVVAPTELVVSASPFAAGVLAEEVLRSDVSTQGLEYPEQYAPRLAATVQRHRVGEILMQVGFVLRELGREPSGDYQAQISSAMAPVTAEIDSVIAAGGRVQLQIHCSTPQWLATHAFPHSVLTGVDEPSSEPTWGCSAPSDLVEWRAIMRGVGEHFASRSDRISMSFGSEPENYFAGTRDELFDWYSASVKGLLDSSKGPEFLIGGLTFVGHREASLMRTAPTLQQGTLTFTKLEYDESLTKSWIEHSASEGLPLHLVTLHQFGGSPVPAAGTYWRRARHDINGWLEANGYAPQQVEVLIEDWPQWAPYTSNDTEYFAAHMAAGILSMLTLSMEEGASIRPLQGFLFDFGFRPPGDHAAGFAGRAGLSTEFGIIKPVFNLNSLLAEVKGALTPVNVESPFVHAVAAADASQTTVIVTNQIPLEYQIDTLYNFWDQRPIFENNFVAEDLSDVAYDRLELLDVFFGGEQRPWPELIDAFLSEPSRIDLDQLSWPAEIKAQWEELRRYGRLARQRRSCITSANLRFEGAVDGRYRVEHYVLDRTHANAYSDRQPLDQRLQMAKAAGREALLREITAINREYDAESGKLPDREIQLTTPREPFLFYMEPNATHVIRLSLLP